MPAESLVRMAGRGESLQRWRATTHLIVDEVRVGAALPSWLCLAS